MVLATSRAHLDRAWNGRARSSITTDVKGQTIQRVASPTAMLVGLPEHLANRCTVALGAGGLRVLRVGHVAAACERIPVVMPQLVLVSTTLRPEEEEMLGERCVAVGAEVMRLAPETDADALDVLLDDAAKAALVRSLRRGG